MMKYINTKNTSTNLNISNYNSNFKYSSSNCEITTTIVLYSNKDSVCNLKVKNT